MSAPPTPVVAVVVDRGDGPHPRVRPVLLGGLQVVAIRGFRTWLQGFLAFLGASFIPTAVPPDATGMVLAPYAGHILVAAQLALLPALVSVCQNALELTAKVDLTNPELRG